MRIFSLVGARPQFVKEAMVNAAVREASAWEHHIVHSGQHYDVNLSDVFFQELGIPEPKYHLNVGSGSHAAMTAAVLTGIEDILLKEKPDALLVYGDTNTTLAGAVAATKLAVPVIHVEAGIRQEPRTMPEEINRRLTDHATALSGGIFACCSETAKACLHAEDITRNITVNGDVMLDVFEAMRPQFDPAKACRNHGLTQDSFLLVTLHRDFNVDREETLLPILRGLERLAGETGLRVFFSVHPRTAKQMERFGYDKDKGGILFGSPVGYVDLMSLALAARAVVTDSGGLQKEAFYAGKRALVVMPDTGWRELTEPGWNLLADPTEDSVATLGVKLLEAHPHPGAPYGTGQAARDMVSFVCSVL